VQEIVYTQIANDATRLAALVSGEIDFVLDPAPRDIARLRNTAGVKIIDGPENRIVFIGMDQGRDELLYSSVKGKNPFKDVRVRKALYHAIDIETMKTKLMNGQSYPTGGLTPSPLGQLQRPADRGRLPYDLAKAKKLMAEAGYGDGFEVTLDCPNNRYINDEEICIALAVDVGATEDQGQGQRHAARDLLPEAREARHQHVHARLGWRRHRCRDHADAGAAQPRRKGRGRLQLRRASKNDKFDALAAQSSVEADAKKREETRQGRAARVQGQAHVLPLHRQVIPWAARTNVTPCTAPTTGSRSSG
jgi:peptide/nickel transport system substrate-binding protein